MNNCKKKYSFTDEELAELAAFDAEIDAAPAPIDAEYMNLAREVDFAAKNAEKNLAEKALAEYKRRYRAAKKKQRTNECKTT